MPQHATSTSFQKGNTAALGNDKTQRLSTWIDKELDKEVINAKTLEGYDTELTKRQVLAGKLVDTAISTADEKMRLEYIKEIADRTEGKPKQSTELTGEGGKDLVIKIVNFDDNAGTDATPQSPS